VGKSDPYVFGFYKSLLPDCFYESVALLGSQKDNSFTASIKCQEKDFYDLGLDNWNINDENWKINKKYDLVVSTRCPYFSKDPKLFIEKCLSILKPGGTALLDWGLGDHWRFDNYKIGWVKDGEHEYAYEEDNFLWSTIWHDSFLENSEFKKFEKNVLKHGYTSVKNAIFKEVPAILELKDITDNYFIGCSILSLWEDLPQLYVPLILKNKERK